MQEHALTSKARALLSQQASLDVSFLETLNEILEQKVYAAEGYSSSHKYLVERLGMSEDSVWRRTKAADLLLRFPALVRPMLETRQVHLTGLAMLHPVLTAENARAVLAEASGKSKAEIHKIVLRYAPREVPRTFVQFVAADKVRMHVNLDAETQQLLERAKDIAPDSNIEVIMKAALAVYVERLEKQRFRESKKSHNAKRAAIADTQIVVGTAARTAEPSSASAISKEGTPFENGAITDIRTANGTVTDACTGDGTANATASKTAIAAAPVRAAVDVPSAGVYVGPRNNKRYVDASTARFVYARDNYRCTFVSDSGHRCGSARNPELHHRQNHAHGGTPTVGNLTVYCKTHNLYQGELDFGPWERSAPASSREAA